LRFSSPEAAERTPTLSVRPTPRDPDTTSSAAESPNVFRFSKVRVYLWTQTQYIFF
jgi:hypothetical protein